MFYFVLVCEAEEVLVKISAAGGDNAEWFCNIIQLSYVFARPQVDSGWETPW